ncbi:uncharacterized protein PF11_0207 [Morus notabilis]|uniref:uncharacterized protein PF11_0207 n=1 Tax=Morus notabilis TaxID=981085 RepID=UPI000CECE5B7|nr:uncharacterized protein PF11_0207 [Morus notabilis]
MSLTPLSLSLSLLNTHPSLSHTSRRIFLHFAQEIEKTKPLILFFFFFLFQMGGNSSRHRRGVLCEKNHVKGLKEKIRFIQEEVSHDKSMYERVKVKEINKSSNGITTTAYEKEMMAFAFKKAEWKQERKKLKEEVKMLKAMVEEKDERIREIEEESVNIGGEKGGCVINGKEQWAFVGANFLVDQMREERARRDETVEKWKQLYLAIKMELDDLIQRTHEGGLYWKAEEEDMAEELKRELQAKEETIKDLKSRLACMERELYKKDREVDILRQSLRIMSSKKVLHAKTPSKKVFVTQGRK